MSKLSRLAGKEGKRFSDLSEEEQKKILKPFIEQFKNLGDKFRNISFNVPNLNNYWKHEAKRKSQPFKTNYLLEDIIKEMQNTTKLTKWVLFFTILIFILTIILLVKN